MGSLPSFSLIQSDLIRGTPFEGVVVNLIYLSLLSIYCKLRGKLRPAATARRSPFLHLSVGLILSLLHIVISVF